MNYEKLCKEKKVALQFSGGKDSLVMLHQLMPYWPLLTVYHCDTGDSFPETREMIEELSKIVPNFVVVKGKRKEIEEQFGFSTDILPVSATPMGQAATGLTLKLIDRYSCCYLSLNKPLHDKMHEDGIEVILRGQRDSDAVKSPVKSGEYIDGFTIIYPLVDYSEKEVFDYLDKHNIPVPRFYLEGMTSGGDCMLCTAWLEHNQTKYVTKFHPKEAKIVLKRLSDIKEAVEKPYRFLTAIGA